MRLRRTTSAVLLACALLAAGASGEETVILKTGEQYQCSVEEEAGGELICRRAGETISFPLGSLQRIDFQRERLFDDARTTQALKEADPLFAAGLEADTADLKARYPEAGYVVLSDHTSVTIRRAGRYEIERTQAWRILEQRGADSASRSIYYFPGIQEPAVVFGVTVGPSGEVAHLSDVAVKDEAVYPAQPEYNYLHRLRFSLKNAVPGATLFLRTRVAGTANLRVPMVVDRTFWGEEPALDRSLALHRDEALRTEISVVTSGEVETSEAGDTWRVTDAPQVFWESLMPPVSAFAPRVVIVHPAADWAEVAGEFNSGLVEGAAVEVGAERAEEIYARVRREVRTVGVPLDALPVPPLPPDEVLEKRYGTIVEKALLLETLLSERGYKASTVLVRGRDNGPLLGEAPRLKGFDGAVVRLAMPAGRTVWLQCDSPKRAFGELSGDVQGASGLDLADGAIITVPARPADMESRTRSSEVVLSQDGSAVVTDSYTLAGREAFGARFIAEMSAREMEKWAASRVGSDLPGVELIDFEHSGFDPPENIESMAFTYRVPSLAHKAGDYLIMRLPNARFSPVAVGRSERRWDLFWLGPEEERTGFRVVPPEGYKPYALPEGAVYDGEGWHFDASFGTRDKAAGQLFYGEVWRRSALEAPKEAYDAYRRALIRRGLLRNEIIVFAKKE